MPTPDQLIHWFKYQGTGTDADKAKHQAIRAAEAECGSALARAMIDGDFQAISDACLTFAVVLNAEAPESADKTAAIRCVRLARMAANEAILLNRRGEPGGVETCGALAMQQLRLARYQGSAAVACGGK
jgi:hypothetical protein